MSEHPYYMGCEDSFGENKPEDIFYDQIMPILKRYNIPENDIKEIAILTGAMIYRAYSNGMEQEAHSNSEL